jgi:hypothetical protein
MALAAVGQRVARARRAAMRGARAAHQLTRYTGDPSRFADLGPLAAAGEPWALGLGPWAGGPVRLGQKSRGLARRIYLGNS